MKCNKCVNFKEKNKDINYYKKEMKDYKHLLYLYMFLYALMIVIFLIYAIFVPKYIYINTISTDKLNISDIDNVINTIENKCGSTQLTHRYGENRWSVFKQFEKDGFTRYDYVALENCL